MRPALPVALGALALTGCGMGPNPDTLIDELRVVASVVEPCEPTFGTPFDVEVVIADPKAKGAEVAVWTCAETCEVARGPLEGDTFAATFTAVAPSVLWTVACAPGRCDLDTLTETDLRDPTDWLAEQPLTGVTAASRFLSVVEPPGSPTTNPSVVEAPDAARLVDVPRGESRRLAFVVPGATTAFGVATGGGFARVSYDVASDGAVTLEWYADDTPGDATVYVVFDGDAGGTAIWSAPASTVR